MSDGGFRTSSSNKNKATDTSSSKSEKGSGAAKSLFEPRESYSDSAIRAGKRQSSGETLWDDRPAIALFSSLGRGIDALNSGIGNAIDTGFDNTLGTWIYNASGKTADPRKWLTGDQIGSGLDFAEDIGLMFGGLPGYIALALKAASQNADTFGEALAGQDLETGEELSDSQRWMKGLTAAGNTALMSTPLIGRAARIGKSIGALKSPFERFLGTPMDDAATMATTEATESKNVAQEAFDNITKKYGTANAKGELEGGSIYDEMLSGEAGVAKRAKDLLNERVPDPLSVTDKELDDAIAAAARDASYTTDADAIAAEARRRLNLKPGSKIPNTLQSQYDAITEELSRTGFFDESLAKTLVGKGEKGIGKQIKRYRKAVADNTAKVMAAEEKAAKELNQVYQEATPTPMGLPVPGAPLGAPPGESGAGFMKNLGNLREQLAAASAKRKALPEETAKLREKFIKDSEESFNSKVAKARKEGYETEGFSEKAEALAEAEELLGTQESAAELLKAIYRNPYKYGDKTGIQDALERLGGKSKGKAKRLASEGITSEVDMVESIVKKINNGGKGLTKDEIRYISNISDGIRVGDAHSTLVYNKIVNGGEKAFVDDAAKKAFGDELKAARESAKDYAKKPILKGIPRNLAFNTGIGYANYAAENGEDANIFDMIAADPGRWLGTALLGAAGRKAFARAATTPRGYGGNGRYFDEFQRIPRWQYDTFAGSAYGSGLQHMQNATDSDGYDYAGMSDALNAIRNGNVSRYVRGFNDES